MLDVYTKFRGGLEFKVREVRCDLCLKLGMHSTAHPNCSDVNIEFSIDWSLRENMSWVCFNSGDLAICPECQKQPPGKKKPQKILNVILLKSHLRRPQRKTHGQ